MPQVERRPPFPQCVRGRVGPLGQAQSRSAWEARLGDRSGDAAGGTAGGPPPEPRPDARARMQEAAEVAKDRVADVRERAADAAATAKERVHEVAETARRRRIDMPWSRSLPA